MPTKPNRMDLYDTSKPDTGSFVANVTKLFGHGIIEVFAFISRNTKELGSHAIRMAKEL